MVADFNKKANREFFNQNLLFKAVAVIFLIVVVVLIVSDVRIYQKKKQLMAQISNYQKQIADIKKSSQTLKNEIANADDKDYLEKLAYEQLGRQKPGEKEVIFIAPKETPKPAAISQNFWENFAGWLSQSWGWIKSKI